MKITTKPNQDTIIASNYDRMPESYNWSMDSDVSTLNVITNIDTHVLQRIGLQASEYQILQTTNEHTLYQYDTSNKKYSLIDTISSSELDQLDNGNNPIIDYVQYLKSKTKQNNKPISLQSYINSSKTTYNTATNNDVHSKLKNDVNEPPNKSKVSESLRKYDTIHPTTEGLYTIRLGELDTFNEEFQWFVEDESNGIHDYESDPEKINQINMFLNTQYKDMLGPYGTQITIDEFNLIHGPGGGFANPVYRITSPTYAGAALGATNIQAQNILSGDVESLVNIKYNVDTAFNTRIYDPQMFTTIDSLVQTIGQTNLGIMMPLSTWEPDWPKKLVESTGTSWNEYMRIMPDDTKEILHEQYIDIETGVYSQTLVDEYWKAREAYENGDDEKSSIDIDHSYQTLNEARNNVYNELNLSQETAQYDPDDAIAKILHYVTENVKYDYQAILDKSIYSLIPETNNLGNKMSPIIMSDYTQFSINNAHLSASDMSTAYYEKTGIPIRFGEPYLDDTLSSKYPEVLNLSPEIVINGQAQTIDENMRKIAAALIDNHGECSGQASTVTFLANGLGLDVKSVGISYPNETIGHAVNEWIDSDNVKHIYDASLSQQDPDTLLITKQDYITNYLPDNCIIIDSPDEMNINESIMINFDGLDENSLYQ